MKESKKEFPKESMKEFQKRFCRGKVNQRLYGYRSWNSVTITLKNHREPTIRDLAKEREECWFDNVQLLLETV